MPHFAIDCSESVLGLLDPAELIAESGVGGIKVQLDPFDHYINVDAHEHFVHVFAYIMEGRTQEQKRVLAVEVVRALKAALPEVDVISMNITDFEKATYSNATMVRTGDGDAG